MGNAFDLGMLYLPCLFQRQHDCAVNLQANDLCGEGSSNFGAGVLVDALECVDLLAILEEDDGWAVCC